MLEAGAPDSLGDLIGARSPEVKARIDEHVEGAFAELDGIKGPMREIAADAPDDLAPLYEHLSELLSAFESDVVSLLDITLGFSDTDGDTG
jgi:predicted lipoprotein